MRHKAQSETTSPLNMGMQFCEMPGYFTGSKLVIVQ